MKKTFKPIIILLVILLSLTTLIGCKKETTEVLAKESKVDDYTLTYSSYVGQLESEISVIKDFMNNPNIEDTIYIDQIKGSISRAKDTSTYFKEIETPDNYKGAQKLFNEASNKFLKGLAICEDALNNPAGDNFLTTYNSGITLLDEGTSLMQQGVEKAQSLKI